MFRKMHPKFSKFRKCGNGQKWRSLAHLAFKEQVYHRIFYDGFAWPKAQRVSFMQEKIKILRRVFRKIHPKFIKISKNEFVQKIGHVTYQTDGNLTRNSMRVI